MHAIIRLGDGKYYVSAVFGYFKNITATDGYEKYLQKIRNPYWIVWDADKKSLIKWFAMVPDTQYIIPQAIIIDANQSNWRKDENGDGCVDFLDKELLDALLVAEDQPKDILEKCRAMDAEYEYEEVREVKTEADVINLSWASGDFHDAYIAQKELLEDGTLYLRFAGVWGCEIEVWFWGELKYDTSCIDSGMYDGHWFDSTVILQDGFVYLVDDEDVTVEKIGPEHCFFKARHMKYRIIPD